MYLVAPEKRMTVTIDDLDEALKVNFDDGIVHAGLALSKLDEGEPRRVFKYLEEMGELGELNDD